MADFGSDGAGGNFAGEFSSLAPNSSGEPIASIFQFWSHQAIRVDYPTFLFVSAITNASVFVDQGSFMFILGIIVIASVHELDQTLDSTRLEAIHRNGIGV